MKAWKVTASPDFTGFECVAADESPPGPGEVSVRLLAAALNHRDVMIAAGEFPFTSGDAVVPLSDACWKVIAVGPGVSRVKPGDRVINIYSAGWIEGRLEPWMWATGFGEKLDGTLTQQRRFSAELLVPVPSSLSDREAATLPCAAVTAWNALFNPMAPLKPGQTVLTLGTGGVSVFAIQLAKAAGARVVATSGSAVKLRRAGALGADILIDSSNTPDWDKRVLEVTGGVGADVVMEVGGPGTMAKSLASVRHGGRIALIGVLADPTAVINPALILTSNAHVHGVLVGNRGHTEALANAIAINGIKPVVDKVYPFSDAPAAFRDLARGTHFGKLVIDGAS